MWMLLLLMMMMMLMLMALMMLMLMALMMRREQEIKQSEEIVGIRVNNTWVVKEKHSTFRC